MDENIRHLGARINALELEQRRYRLFALAISVLAVLCAVGWQSVDHDGVDIVRAHRVEILDDKGQVAVSLGYEKRYGGGAVSVFNENGKRGSLVGAHGGGLLKLTNGADEAHESSIFLSVSNKTQSIGTFGPPDGRPSGIGATSVLETYDGRAFLILEDSKKERTLTSTGETSHKAP